MAGQKMLEAAIRLVGVVDNSFGQIGSKLIELSAQIDEISQKLIDFGKESLNVYKDYEYNMKELESVWGTNGTFQAGSTALRSAMNDMNTAAANWAHTSIFHTNDVSNAMVEAAHAGWDYNQMLEGMPAAMAMAQAGSMDLSTAMNYVLKAQKDFGWEFDDIGTRMDEWIYAANRSAGTAEEFGDTFLKMGSTVRFALNTEELLALTKVMHDMGTTGSQAGTLIKTSLMKLYAPSGKASKVLEALGVSAEEIKEAGIMDDRGLLEALGTLEEFGFSAFDEAGQAKPVLQAYSELGEALIAISGYTQRADETQEQFYERVLKNQKVMGIMSEVFGIRGIQGSMNILMSLNEAMGMYNDLTNDAADGTTEYVRSMMNDTLYGSTELLQSKVEDLQRLVGEKLAPDVENIQGYIGNIIDDITSMDDTKLGAWADALKVVAVAGPGLYITGRAFRFIGNLLTPTGIVGMGAITLAAIASAVNEIQEADFKDKFGNMNLDTATLNEYIKTLGDDFNTAFEKVNSFQEALGQSVENYKTASSTFSSDLLSAVLTKTELSPDDIAKFESMGTQIYTTVLESINASSNAAAAFWSALYGGDEVSVNDPRFKEITDLLIEGRDSLTAQAETIQQKIHEAMLKGYEEGFDEDDYDAILGYFREYNGLVAKAQYQAAEEAQFIEQEKLLRQAQTAGIDDVWELAKAGAEQRDAQIAELTDDFENYRAGLKYWAKQTGMTDEEAEVYLQSQRDSEGLGVDEAFNKQIMQTNANYDEFMMTLWGTTLRSNGLTDAYKSLGEYADYYLGGDLTAEAAMQAITDEMGASKFAGDFSGSETSMKAQLGKALGLAITSLGGVDEIAKRIEYYDEAGNGAMADRLRRLLTMEQLALGFSDVTKTERDPLVQFINAGTDFATSAMGSDIMDAYIGRTTEEKNRALIEAWANTPEELPEPSLYEQAMAYADEPLETTDWLQGYIDEKIMRLNKVNAMIANREDVLKQQRVWIPDAEDDVLSGENGFYAERAALEEQIETFQSAKEMLESGAALNDVIDELKAEIAELESSMEYWNALGDTSESGLKRKADIEAELGAKQALFDELTRDGDYGVSFPVEVTGAVEATSAAIKEAQAYAVDHAVVIRVARLDEYFTGSVLSDDDPAYYHEGANPRMARGGRETRPAIFAEAGIPEWFIPEEHTANTARLILGAAYGSGFDIVELAAMAGARLFAEGGTTGGMSLSGMALDWGAPLPANASASADGDTSGGGIQITYSPVIHAPDTEGVRRALKEDKQEFERKLEEWWARKQLYESMVKY